MRLHRYAPRTVKLYVNTIRNLETWLDDRALTAEAVLDYAATLPFTYASQQRLMNALKAYWRLMKLPGPCPADSIRCPSRPRMRYRGVEPENARAIIEAAGRLNARHRAVCALLYYAGLRNEEAASLTHDEDQGEWLAVVGKGAQSGLLPVHPVLREALDAIGPRGDSPYFFPGRRRGTHISTMTVNMWVRLAAAAAGLGHVTPHQLRYTCGGTMLDETGDLRAVNQFLRHSKSSIAVTAGYTRTTDAKMLHLMSVL